MTDVSYTLPGLSDEASTKTIELLQHRLAAYNDLHLTLKHVHWNVVGPNFIAVHEMIDPQVELVRGYADEVAERIATMGGSPGGRTGDIAALRDWDDYDLRRDTVQAHLAALDKVYSGVVSSNRAVIAETESLDPVTQDMVIGQTAELEKFQWFVRAHLENASGQLVSEGTSTEAAAADAAR